MGEAISAIKPSELLIPDPPDDALDAPPVRLKRSSLRRRVKTRERPDRPPRPVPHGGRLRPELVASIPKREWRP